MGRWVWSVVGLVVLLLVGCHRAAVPVESHTALETLIRMAPYDTQWLLAIDVRKQVNLVDEVRRLEEGGAKDKRLADAVEQFRHDMGLSPDALAKWAQPAALAVAFPPQDGQPLMDAGAVVLPDVALVLAVSDETEATNSLEKIRSTLAQDLSDSGDILKHPAKAVPIRIENVPAWLTVAGDTLWVYAVDHGYLFVTRNVRSMQKMLQTAHGSLHTLADNDRFAEAGKSVPLTDGIFTYVALQPSLSTVLRGPDASPSFDKLTLDAMSGLQYFIGEFHPDEDGLSGEAHLKVDSKSQSPFIQTLIRPVSGDLSAAQYIPADMHSVIGLNLEYLFNTLLETVRLDVAYRKEADKVRDELTVYQGFTPQQLFDTLNGPIVVATDWVENRAKEGTVLMVCPCKSPTAAQDLLSLLQKKLLTGKAISVGPGISEMDHLAWCIGSKPSGALLFAFGPKRLEWLKAALVS